MASTPKSDTEARAKAKEARDLIRTGTDPGEKKKAIKREAAITHASTFEIVAREWMESPGKRLWQSASTRRLCHEW